jgi:transposase
MWFVGLDWADEHHDICVITDAGKQIGSLRIAHTPGGFQDLKDFLLSLTGPNRKEEVVCIVETNHGLLIAWLLETGYPVYPVNPKTVDRHRSASGAKTDKIDAYLLAKHGRSEIADMRRLEPDSAIVAELKALTRDQDGLIRSQTRLVNQLTACLKAYYPVALHLFSKVQQRCTLAFLQTYPTPQEVMAASIGQIAQVLKEAGHPTANKVAPKIFETLHQPQLTADAITTRTKARLMLVLIKQLQPLVEEIWSFDIRETSSI